MNDAPTNTARAAWTAPELVELDLDMTRVENGTAPGTDGGTGFNTSLVS